MASRVLAVAAVLIAAACGGGKKDGGNPAATKTFTYGTAVDTTSMPLDASDAVSSAIASKSSLDASSSMDAPSALFAAADAALNAQTGASVMFADAPARVLPFVRSTRWRAFGPIAGSTEPGLPSGCYTVVPNSRVTFSGCRITETDTTGYSATVALDGFVAVNADTVTWDLLITVAGGDADGTMNLGYDDSGSFTVSPASAKAHQEVTLTFAVSSGGQSFSFGVAQAADLDVALGSCPVVTGITSGTFEAKRVWFRLPAEAKGEPEFRDVGVKFTWTSCGAGRYQVSL